jgi:4-hydroxybenzoate polyprenyltransferase
MYQIILLLRPWQWIKNILIFIPFILSSQNTIDSLNKLIFIFIIFSLFVSSTYIFNDLKDVNTDRLHPIKKGRPIAAGKISVSSAKLLALNFFISGLIISYLLDPSITVFFLAYAVFTYLYTMYFKYIFLLDTLSISIMFLIRVLIGSFAVKVPLTIYLGTFIFFTSCMLSISKKISIINSAKLNSDNSFYALLKKQNATFSFSKLFIFFGLISSISLLLWFLNLYGETRIFSDIILLGFTNVAFVFFVSNIYKYSLMGELEDFSKELFKNKYLFFLATTIVVSFSIGYF